MPKAVLKRVHPVVQERTGDKCRNLKMKKSNKQRKPCVVLGGGGHARSLLEAFHDGLPVRPCAVLDANRALWKHRIAGIPVIGDDSCLPRLLNAGVRHFAIGLGAIGDNRPRRRLFDAALGWGLQPACIIHRTACISPSARIVAGAQILAGAIVGAGAVIEENAIVNTGAIVEHDCRIRAHTHIASGATLCGNVVVGIGAHVGAGAVVMQGVTIGDWAVVGAGAVVIRDVTRRSIVVGVPARPRPGAGTPPKPRRRR